MIPVLLLTGFLGSGKTTLLGHLLRQREFAHTAVIINEFGEVGLDHDLIEASDDSFVELATGCLCCRLRNDLSATLGDMLRRREEGTVPPFTRVVIETSGLADPAPILQTLMTDDGTAGLMAGFGVKLWTILQNVGQLKQHYQQSWETFFANAGVITGFGVIDEESQRALSIRLGNLRLVSQVPSGAVGSELQRGAPPYRDERVDVPLLAPDELGRILDRDERRMLVLGAGLPPAVVERFIYHDKNETRAPVFDKLYDEPRR